MQIKLAVTNTDKPNRYGFIFGVDALVSSLRQTWRYGTPMLISHDFHRPLGWTQSLGLQLNGQGAALVAKMLFPESEADHDAVRKSTKAYLNNHLSDIDDADVAMLTAQIGNLTTDEASFLRRETVCVVDKGIAQKRFPDLFRGPDDDKHSLTPLRQLTVVGPGVYAIGELCVFAHRYFRRSLSQVNNFNDAFLSKFEDLAKNDGLDTRIAIDPDSIGLASTYKSAIELAYWWGPKFTESLTDIQLGIARHESNDREKFFHRIGRTEFWWHRQSGIQSFECEEVVEGPSLGVSQEQYGCRYVHSMIDECTQRPHHLDGAVRLYDEDTFVSRLDKNIAESGKVSDYTKLWRIDGDIKVSVWKELICHYFRDNSLVGEYLNGEDARPKIENAPSSDQADTLPNPIALLAEQDGVDVFVAFDAPEKSVVQCDVEVVVLDWLGNEKEGIRYLEFSALDLIKAIRSYGLTVHLDPAIEFVAFEDLDINFPLLLHRGVSAGVNAQQTLLTVSRLLEAICARGKNRNITFSIAVEFEETSVAVSYLGHIAALTAYLQKPEQRTLPTSLDDVPKWCERMKSDAQKSASSLTRRDGLRFLENTGVYRIRRSFVPNEIISFDDKNQLMLDVSGCTPELVDGLSSGRVKAVPAARVRSARCSSCGAEYRDCRCSTFLQSDVTVLVSDFELMGFAWAESRRPIPDEVARA